MTNLPVKASVSLKAPSSKGPSCGPKVTNLPEKANVSLKIPSLKGVSCGLKMTNLPVKARVSLKVPSSKGVSYGPKMTNLPVKASVSQSAILEGSIVWTKNDQLTGKGERKSKGYPRREYCVDLK